MNVRHYVVTNRLVDLVRVQGQPDQYWYRFDGNSDADVATPFMRCGRYVDSDNAIAAPVFYPPAAEDADYNLSAPGFDPLSVKASGSSLEMLQSLFSELDHLRKDLLIFNFGYENRKQKEFGHLKYFHDKYISPSGSPLGRVLMITWPSQGFGQYDKEIGGKGLIARTMDRWFNRSNGGRTQAQINNDVKVTGDALAIFLLKLSRFRKERYQDAAAGTFVPKINFIVQSMANSILAQCLLRLKEWNALEGMEGMISRLMLTAPDVPSNIFETNAAFAEGMCIAERVYIVSSEQDLILKASDVFHNIPGTKRLGISGAKNPSLLPSNVYQLKVTQSRISFDPPDHNHRYFVYNQQVVDKYLHIFSSGNTEREEPVNA